VFNNYTKKILVNGKPVNLGLWDTAGQEDYDQLRPMSYAKTDIFLVCFDVDSQDSYANVKNKWIPEILKFSPQTPFLVIGTKKDLRASVKKSISESQGQQLAREVGAMAYLECSALNQGGLKQVFDIAVRTAAQRKSGESDCCTIL